MKHVMADSKSVLVGDEAADLLIRYAVLLGQSGSADSVDLDAVESTGNTTRVTFLLNSGTSLTSESANSDLDVPDNTEAESYLAWRIAEIERLRYPTAEDILGTDPSDTH